MHSALHTCTLWYFLWGSLMCSLFMFWFDNMHNETSFQLLAAVAGVKETYHNTKVLLGLLDIDKLPSCYLVADLKALSFLLGIQTARAK